MLVHFELSVPSSDESSQCLDLELEREPPASDPCKRQRQIPKVNKDTARHSACCVRSIFTHSVYLLTPHFNSYPHVLHFNYTFSPALDKYDMVNTVILRNRNIVL